MVKRIASTNCCGLIIDVQDYFLSQIDPAQRASVETNTGNFIRLLGHFRIPLIVTLEQPIADKGTVPQAIAARLDELADPAAVCEKDFFDLTKERAIRDRLARLNKRQAVVAGCETDVCILQSCLGLLQLGYEVFAVEELLFTSSPNADAALERMQREGVVFLSYKTLYYELVEAVGCGAAAANIVEAFGPLPADLPDCAE